MTRGGGSESRQGSCPFGKPVRLRPPLPTCAAPDRPRRGVLFWYDLAMFLVKESGPIRTPVNYKSYARALIKTGDVFLFDGRSWFSRAIRRMTGSYRSHAALAVVALGRVWIVESREFIGVRIIPLSNLLRDGANVGWYQHVARRGVKGMPPLDTDALSAWCVERVGDKYAYAAIARIVAAILPWRRVLSPVDGEPLPRRAICSAFVAAAIRVGGRDLVPSRADAVTTPGDIERSGLLAYAGELVLEAESENGSAS